MSFRLNLGSEDNLLDGFENLDPRKFDGVKYWEWNKELPYKDASVELVVVQHSLMYCPAKDRDWNFKEIHRVLSKGAKFILKEEDDRFHQWRKVGTHHKTGHICSSTNPEDIIPYLIKNGFCNFVNDSKKIVEKYGAIINRQRKLFRGMMFVIECEKS